VIAGEMSKEEGLREMTYQMVMRASWKMLQSGLLSEDEYLEFEGKMREKYLASAGSSGYYTHDFSIMDLKDSKSDKITKDSG